MRVKTGITRRKRHKKILKATKGYRMTKGKLYKVSHEAYMHAGQYSYNHRHRRHSQMRQLWIKRINAAAGLNGMKYNEFVSKVTKAGIELNKKSLAEIALNHPQVFTKVAEAV